MIVIKGRNLTKVYPTGIKALDSITLSLEEQKIHAILGPNGAGKTTFLRMVATEIAPTSGTLTVLGRDCLRDRDKDDIRRNIGVMPQQARLYVQLTAWEFVYYFTLLRGMSRTDSARQTDRVLKMLGLYDRRTEQLDRFSGGMQQAINLAQAITCTPDLLLLDEPTTGLDPERRRLIWDYIKQLSENRTVLLSTQYLDEAAELADNIIIFNQGHLLMEGDQEFVLRTVNYQARVRLPAKRVDMNVLSQQSDLQLTQSKDEMIIWAKDAQTVLQTLAELNIELTAITIERPELEQAYLEIINRARRSNS